MCHFHNTIEFWCHRSSVFTADSEHNSHDVVVTLLLAYVFAAWNTPCHDLLMMHINHESFRHPIGPWNFCQVCLPQDRFRFQMWFQNRKFPTLQQASFYPNICGIRLPQDPQDLEKSRWLHRDSENSQELNDNSTRPPWPWNLRVFGRIFWPLDMQDGTTPSDGVVWNNFCDEQIFWCFFFPAQPSIFVGNPKVPNLSTNLLTLPAQTHGADGLKSSPP